MKTPDGFATEFKPLPPVLTREQEPHRALHLALAAVHELAAEDDTGFGIWHAYWTARLALRDLAVGQCQAAWMEYLRLKESPDVVKETLDAVENDVTEDMRVVATAAAGQPEPEEVQAEAAGAK